MPAALALDPGTKRIGVAGCDPLGISVKPLPFVPARPEDEALRALAAVVAERGAQVVVLGLPVNMDGTEGPAARSAREFGARLAGALPAGIRFVFWNEQLTTDEAEKRLLERGLSHRERKQVIDSLSAAILLKSWLDEGAPETDETGG
jgi:putative Holliday junction resolvase